MSFEFWTGKEITPSAKIYNSFIEVFRTDITRPEQATYLNKVLLASCPNCKINFDLEDCDKIPRIESDYPINLPHIYNLGNAMKIQIVELRE